MNAKEALRWMEHDTGIMSCNDDAWPIVIRALRLLAAAEANDGSTPETDAEWRAMGDLARRLERERNGLAARVRELEPDAERYRWVPVTERLPVVDGPGVFAYDARTRMPLGVVRYTTSEGNLYAGTENDGEPVWMMWAQFDPEGPQVLIEPGAVSHWMAVPPLPHAARSK